MIHLTSEAKKSQGAHYTPQELAQFVARQMIAAWRLDRTELTQDKIDILDPSVGGGDLLEAILFELNQDERSRSVIHGMDCDPVAVKIAKDRLGVMNPRIHITTGDYLDTLNGTELDLFSRENNATVADLVIANPPYVRTQVLGADKSQAIANKFSLTGRVDLSYPFILGIIEALRPGGVAGIITSNRFLSTLAGATLRERLLSSARILQIWDLGDTKLFEAAVLPCVLILKKEQPHTDIRFTSVYSTTPQEKKPDPLRLFTALSSDSISGVVQLGEKDTRYEIKRGFLECTHNQTDIWKLRNEESSNWEYVVKRNTWKSLNELAKVRVGIKTTSDSVFIRDDWESACPDGLPETLQPLITHHLSGRFKGISPTKKVLYTHEYKSGKKQPINLDYLPLAAKYLERHRDILEARTYVINSGRKWYEVWVPQDPAVWSMPKIIFKDIAEKPTFWLDLDGSVVNGDCYWFTLGKELSDLHWLALGVFNSSFIEKYYDTHFSNKLYSGRRRFMTQYVSQFPLPNPESISAQKIISLSKSLFNDPSREAELSVDLNNHVLCAFGLSIKET